MIKAGLLPVLFRRMGVHAYRVLSRPLSLHAVASPAGIALRVLNEEELLVHCADEALELPLGKARAALRRGEVCAGAFDGARLVGYAWFAFEPAPHVDGVWMAFDPRAIYIYRAFVRPGYRGRRIAPALYRSADGAFLARGRTFAVLCVELHNKPSLTAARRSGARSVGLTVYLHTRGGFTTMRTRGVRDVGYRFYVPRLSSHDPEQT